MSDRFTWAMLRVVGAADVVYKWQTPETLAELGKALDALNQATADVNQAYHSLAKQPAGSGLETADHR